MTWLLDTCVLSEYVKKEPTRAVIDWLDEQDESALFISVLAVGEIQKGILKLRGADARRSQKLSTWLGKVERRFARRILPLDLPTLRAWAQLSAAAELSAHRLPVIDALLMATAQYHGLTVVTRNTKDFRFCPRVFNPWQV